MTTKATATISATTLALGLAGGYALSPSCPPGLMGDGDHNGVVNFDDYTAWVAGYGTTSPPWNPPPVDSSLTLWASQHVKAVYPQAIEGLEFPESSILVVDVGAGAVAHTLSLDPRLIRGIRSITWPGGYPSWPPPGSALELLMEWWVTDSPAVEAAALRVLNELPPTPPSPPSE